MGRNADHSFWGVGISSMFGSISHQPSSAVATRTALGWWSHTRHDLLDKIDPANLVRDTRIAARVVWRLLSQPVLPLDIAAQLAPLIAELEKLAGALAGRHGSAALLEAARACQAAASLPNTSDPERWNQAVMRASRLLVPLDYTSGDRFQPDPALPQPGWPILGPYRALATNGLPVDEAYALSVSATRAGNRLRSALREACSIIAAAS